MSERMTHTTPRWKRLVNPDYVEQLPGGKIRVWAKLDPYGRTEVTLRAEHSRVTAHGAVEIVAIEESYQNSILNRRKMAAKLRTEEVAG